MVLCVCVKKRPVCKIILKSVFFILMLIQKRLSFLSVFTFIQITLKLYIRRVQVGRIKSNKYFTLKNFNK